MLRLPKLKRILIVRPDRIGDVVLSTSLPREIKKQYPDSHVAVLVRDYTKELFVNNPYVDTILSKDDFNLETFSGYIKTLLKLRKLDFNIALTLLPTSKLSWLLFFAGIKLRIGVGHKFYQFITNAKSVYRRKYKPLRHEADFCMDTIRKIGISSNDYSSEIYLSEIEKQNVSKIRKSLLNGRRYLVGIHSGSGKSAPNWSPERYAELIDKLHENPEIEVVATDNEIVEQFSKFDWLKFPNKGIGLREAIQNFAALDLLVSASTGPMHICGALKRKTVALFCPLIACSPKLWGAAGNDALNLLPEENYCSVKCPGDPKKCNLEGEGGITFERVATEVEQKLRN